MTDLLNGSLLEPLLDSWDRNNRILVNLARLVPEGGLGARATADSPTVAQMFTHIHYVRLIVITEDAPELAGELVKELPAEEWMDERDAERIARMLEESAKAVRITLQKKIEAGGEMKLRYDHPLLFLQHMIWHEGYHHGQIKLALKLAGQTIDDETAGAGTWHLWFDKTR
jgi:uncharacterized damage-inducible protein DinB